MKAELNSSSGARLILVPPGSFILGSPPSEQGHMPWEEEREVTLSHEFYLGATPLTTAIVMRHKRIIQILVDRCADTAG